MKFLPPLLFSETSLRAICSTGRLRGYDQGHDHILALADSFRVEHGDGRTPCFRFRSAFTLSRAKGGPR
jgi:hypothetical protein